MSIIGLMSCFGFLQDDSKAAATEIEALLDSACDGYFGAVSGDAEALAINPHAPGAVIDLENAVPHGSKRVRRLPGDGYVLAGILTRIFVDVRNAGGASAAREAEYQEEQQ